MFNLFKSKRDKLELRVIKLETMVGCLADEKEILKKEIRELKDTEGNTNNPFMRYFRQSFSWLRALTEYLGLEEYRSEIPDISYIPKEQPMIPVVKVRKKPPKKKPK